MHLIRKKGFHRGVIGVESAIVMIAFVIVAAALAFVVLNMGFTTSQKAKTSIISGLGEVSGSLQISGKIIGVQCLTGYSDCGSSLAAISIPLKITSGGDSVNLDPTKTIIRYQSNTVEHSDIYNGTINTSVGFVHVLDLFNYRTQIFDSSGTYQSQFGSSGSGNGQFNTPEGIAVDASGNIYVSDTANHRVQIFDSSGTYQSQFGSSGSGNGEFSSPEDVVVDASGKIYVLDTNNVRVQIFDSSGTYQSQFGFFGFGFGGFIVPKGVAVDTTGNIYVSDIAVNAIQIFDSSGTYQSQFGSSGSGNGQFSSPQGIAIDASGNIYVSDTANHRVQIFDSSGTYQSQFGSSGSGNGEFSSPEDVVVDASGNIYVSDTGNHRVQIFDSSGTYQSQFGSSGSGDGQFNTPVSIAVNSFNKSFISTIGLAAGNGLITSALDSTVGATVSQTQAWIFFPVTSSYNFILDQGEHASLVIAFSASDRPSKLDKIKVEIVTTGGSTLSVERQVPTISNAIIDLG